MCEAIAQLGAVAVLSDPRYAGRLPLFGGIDKARFRRQASPGDTLELGIEMTRLSARAGRGRGSARVDGVLAVECDLLFVIADPAADIAQAGAITRVPLWPPKPKELEMDGPGVQGSGWPVTTRMGASSGSS